MVAQTVFLLIQKRVLTSSTSSNNYSVIIITLCLIITGPQLLRRVCEFIWGVFGKEKKITNKNADGITHNLNACVLALVGDKAEFAF